MSFYKFALSLVRGFCNLIFRIKVEGLENVPLDESFVVCANHKSNFDALMIGISMPVEFNFMAKEEVFKFKPFGKLLKALHAFPVKRGKGDIGAIKSSMKVLNDGGHLVIFPEGTRSPKGYMAKGKGGAVLIALKAGVNIIPVGIEGSYKLFSKMTVRIGKPLDLSENKGQKIDSELISDILDNRLMPVISELAKVPIIPDGLPEGEAVV